MTIHDDPWRDARFRKSTRSQGANNCVEVARPKALFGVRDSKHSDGPVLSFTESQGLAFLGLVKQD